MRLPALRPFRGRLASLRLAVGLCVALPATACSVVMPGAFATSPPTAASIPGTASTAHPIPQVVHPWRPGIPQLGVNVSWTGNSVDSGVVVAAKARRIVNYVLGLDANSVALTIPFYTYGITSDTLYPDKVMTPSPAHVALFLKAATESHLRVTVRLVLNENRLIAQNPIAWRGSIQPASMSAWFASYQRLLLPYARVAQSGGAASFVVGTELDSLEGAPEWPALVSAIRSVYHGEVMYDENFTSFAAHDTNLPVSAFGVDAYPRFQLPDSASVAQLTSAWLVWLNSHSTSVLHRAVLSEVGITATSGAYQVPGDWVDTAHKPIIPQIQDTWYKAVCNAVTADKLGGVYWWEVSFDADPVHPAIFLTDRLTFLDRPAQHEIKSCFAALSR
jgi:hypothetical protein